MPNVISLSRKRNEESMKDATEWLQRLDKLCLKYESTLQPAATVNADLNQLVILIDSPVDAIYLDLDRADPFKVLQLGAVGEGEPTDTEQKELNTFICRLRIWKK